MNLANIAQGAAVEAERQGVGLPGLVRLLGAYEVAMTHANASMAPLRLPDEVVLRVLARTVEPVKADRYRVTPVTFASGGSASPAAEVPHAIHRLFNILSDISADEIDENVARQFTRAFLAIHPFADGNGRTAWILFNWISGTLDNPKPLPDFAW